MSNKVSNKTISSAWTSGKQTSDQVVGNKDEIPDADKSSPNEPVPHPSRKWCGTGCNFNVWFEGAYKKIGAAVGFLSAVATIVGLLAQFYSSRAPVGKISSI